MNIYKVTFTDNEPVASELEGQTFTGRSEFDHNGTGLIVKTLEVMADSERESMVIAGQFAKDGFKNRLKVLCAARD